MARSYTSPAFRTWESPSSTIRSASCQMPAPEASRSHGTSRTGPRRRSEAVASAMGIIMAVSARRLLGRRACSLSMEIKPRSTESPAVVASSQLETTASGPRVIRSGQPGSVPGQTRRQNSKRTLQLTAANVSSSPLSSVGRVMRGEGDSLMGINARLPSLAETAASRKWGRRT
jgi:hypothetical protein